MKGTLGALVVGGARACAGGGIAVVCPVGVAWLAAGVVSEAGHGGKALRMG